MCVHLADRVVQESAKNAKKSENAGEKLAFFTPDLTGKSLSERTWCLAPFLKNPEGENRHGGLAWMPVSTIPWVLLRKTHSSKMAWMPFLSSARD
jgi:hypothetical protein